MSLRRRSYGLKSKKVNVLRKLVNRLNRLRPLTQDVKSPPHAKSRDLGTEYVSGVTDDIFKLLHSETLKGRELQKARAILINHVRLASSDRSKRVIDKAGKQIRKDFLRVISQLKDAVRLLDDRIANAQAVTL